VLKVFLYQEQARKRSRARRGEKKTKMPQLARQTGTSLSEINIVPFVDVMLVLLVIFMITAPILQSGIEVDVPKTKTVKEISESRVVVSIDRAQRIYIGDAAVNIHELGDKVHAQMHNPQGDAVYLRCDKTVPFGAFALVVDTMRQSGIQNISVVTEPLDETPH
jgi:biopolymer transport protein TolR